MQSTEPPAPLRDPAAHAQSPAPVPERFTVSRAVLRLDRFMTYAIMVGGVGIIASVFGIFVFIGSVIWPLFQGPTLTPVRQIALATSGSALVGLDERSELPFSYNGSTDIAFYGADTTIKRQSIGLDPSTQVSAWRQDRHGDRILLGTHDGRVGFCDITFTATQTADSRSVAGSVKLAPWLQLVDTASPTPTPTPTPTPSTSSVESLDYAGQGERKLFGALVKHPDATRLIVVGQRQKKGLMGGGKLEPSPPEDLTHLLAGAEPVRVLLPVTADAVVVQTRDHELLYLFRSSSGWELRQRLKPFADSGSAIASMDFLYGDVSLVLV